MFYLFGDSGTAGAAFEDVKKWAGYSAINLDHAVYITSHDNNYSKHTSHCEISCLFSLLLSPLNNCLHFRLSK